jgi:hypothetical protein
MTPRAALTSLLASAALLLSACGAGSDSTTGEGTAQQQRRPSDRPQLSGQQAQQFAAFTNCLKQHGVAFPSPGQGGPGAGGGGVNPRSQKFRSAMRKCQQYAPQGVGGGAPGGAPPGDAPSQ